MTWEFLHRSYTNSQPRNGCQISISFHDCPSNNTIASFDIVLFD